MTFDPGDTSGGVDVNGNTSRPVFITLAHELAHGEDYLNSTLDNSTLYSHSDGKVIRNAEKYATHVENQGMTYGRNLPKHFTESMAYYWSSKYSGEAQQKAADNYKYIKNSRYNSYYLKYRITP